MKVSVIYPTARHGGLDILEKCMKEQTHEDFEVLILDELRRNFMPNRSTKFIFVEPPNKKAGMFWNLSASLNAGVRAAKGELIVLLQDYIWVPKEGLARYVEKAIQEPKGLISGVGHQYEFPAYNDDPTGAYSIWKDWPGEPSGEKTFTDPRMERPGFYLCNPVEWEANWSCFRKEVWETIGGFDEEFDAGWGYDNVNFSERAQLAGYHLFLDTHNEVKCYSHINIFKEQKVRDAAPNNQKMWYKKYMDLDRGMAPWKLNYL